MATPEYAANFLTPSDIITASSTGGAAANNVTLAAGSRTAFLTGFSITGLGATAASTIAITTTGLQVNLTWYLAIPAGVTTAVTPLILSFPIPLPANNPGVNIVINVPSFGAGNTTAAANAYGFLM